MRASVRRDLETILRAAERLERAFAPESSEMQQLIGGIRVNAEDALDTLGAQERLSRLYAWAREPR